MEVFISLNYQKRKNKKRQKTSRRKPRFAAL
nr:MAG TPA: hypothetical protein [Caudoviricetes sp.]